MVKSGILKQGWAVGWRGDPVTGGMGLGRGRVWLCWVVHGGRVARQGVAVLGGL